MKPILDRDQCTGCGNCIRHCPAKILRIAKTVNQRNVYPIEIFDEARCLSCGTCELMCTAGAIHFENAPLSGFELIDKQAIPPHAGCYLGSLSKALADCIMKTKLRQDIVIFKKKTADVNLKVETHETADDRYYEDGLAYKQKHPDKLVLLICSSSKQLSTAENRKRILSLKDASVTIINTLNWFETEDFQGVSKGGSRLLEEASQKENCIFCARGSVRSPREMRQLTDYLQKALEYQRYQKGFSLVEIVFPCFYRLANRPQVLMTYQQIDPINRWFDQAVKANYKEGIIKE